MEHRQLIIENDDIKQLDYLTRLLATDARIIYVVEIGANYTIIDVDLPASYIATFNKFVAKAIVVTEKFNYLSELIDMVNMDYVRATFFSTLLYFDIQQEIGSVAKGIEEDKTISLSGVFNFRFGKIKEEWGELVELIATILHSPHEDEDIYSISAFMLSSRTNTDKTIFIAEYPEIMLTNVTDGVMCDIIGVYGNSELDLIDSLVGECPKEVIVETDKVPSELIDVLKMIMTVKLL